MLRLLLVSVVVGSIGTSAQADLDLPKADVPGTWQECGVNLLKLAGKTKEGSRVLPDLYASASQNKDPQFLKYLMAVIFTESRFDKHAKSYKDAVGLMQVTRIAMQDTVSHCKLPIIPMEKLYDSFTNVKYGSCYLNHMLQLNEGNYTKALLVYNGGYRQLQKYEMGDSVASESANYVLKVKKALTDCN